MMVQQLTGRLPNDVLLNGVCSTEYRGTDDVWSGHVR